MMISARPDESGTPFAFRAAPEVPRCRDGLKMSSRDSVRACLRRPAGLVGQTSSLSARGLPARGTACRPWGWKPVTDRPEALSYLSDRF